MRAAPEGGTPETPLQRWTLAVLESADDALHLAIGLLLIALAAATFLHIAAKPFLHPDGTFLETSLDVVNNVLFVIIILEILRTVTAHLQGESFALRPFLIIGIISAVRHLLIVGAQMSITEHANPGVNARLLDHPTVELMVNAGVAVAMVAAYYIVCQVKEEAADIAKKNRPGIGDP